MKKNRLLLLALIILSLAIQCTAQTHTLEVKGKVIIDPHTYNSKNISLKKIVFREDSELYLYDVVLTVSNNITSTGFYPKFIPKGNSLIICYGQSELISKKIIESKSKTRFKIDGIKSTDFIKLYSLNGSLVSKGSYAELQKEKIKCDVYNLHVKNRGFRSNYLVVEK